MPLRTEYDVTIILQICGKRWFILYNDLTENCRKRMKLMVSIALRYGVFIVNFEYFHTLL